MAKKSPMLAVWSAIAARGAIASTPSGKGYRVTCPLHGGTGPTVQVEEGPGGVSCSEGCATSAILKSWGLCEADLLPGNVEAARQEQPDAR